MNALVVGFGAMGCRHAQALISSQQYREISVVEPSDERFSEGLSKIGISAVSVSRFKSLGEFKLLPDIAIIATSSAPRYEIMKTCIARGIKHFLVEKIVFQSLSQFDHIISLLSVNGARAYCNFVNRYFPNYIGLKDRISGVGKRLVMTVAAGNLGLGCNAVHYMDLFEYLSGREMVTSSSSLSVWDRPNKRGDIYREFSGLLAAETENNDLLKIYFDPSHSGSVTLDISFDKQSFLFSEGDRSEFAYDGFPVTKRTFDIIPTSRLSHILVDEIMHNRSVLPSVAATRNVHDRLFGEINKALGLPARDETLCPIT